MSEYVKVRRVSKGQHRKNSSGKRDFKRSLYYAKHHKARLDHRGHHGK